MEVLYCIFSCLGLDPKLTKMSGKLSMMCLSFGLGHLIHAYSFSVSLQQIAKCLRQIKIFSSASTTNTAWHWQSKLKSAVAVMTLQHIERKTVALSKMTWIWIRMWISPKHTAWGYVFDKVSFLDIQVTLKCLYQFAASLSFKLVTLELQFSCI